MSHGRLNTQVVARKIVFLLYDIFSVIMASGLALLLRFEFSFDKVETQYIDMMWRMLPAAVVITIAFFWIFIEQWRNKAAKDLPSKLYSLSEASYSAEYATQKSSW